MGNAARKSAIFISLVLVLSTVANAVTTIEDAREETGDLLVKTNNLLETLEDIDEELDWILKGTKDAQDKVEQEDQFGALFLVDEAINEKALIENVKHPEAVGLKAAIENELEALQNIIDNLDPNALTEEQENSINNKISQIAGNLSAANQALDDLSGEGYPALNNELGEGFSALFTFQPSGEDFLDAAGNLENAEEVTKTIIEFKEQEIEAKIKKVKNDLNSVAQALGGAIFTVNPNPEEIEELLDELFDLEQKLLEMRERLEFMNEELDDLEQILNDAIQAIKDGNEGEAFGLLQNAKDYVELIHFQKSIIEEPLLEDFANELEGLFIDVEGSGLDDRRREKVETYIFSLDNLREEMSNEFTNINGKLGEGGFIDGESFGNDLHDYLNNAQNELEVGEGGGAIFILEELALPAVEAVKVEKEFIEGKKIDLGLERLDRIASQLGNPIPPEFDPDSPALNDFKMELFDLREKGEEFRDLLEEVDMELDDMRELLLEARSLTESGGAGEGDFDSVEPFKEALRLIERAIVIKHIIKGPLGEGIPDGVKVQELKELREEVVEELDELSETLEELCIGGFIDERRCNLYFSRSIQPLFALWGEEGFIPEELSVWREALIAVDEELEGEGGAINNLENLADGEDGENQGQAIDSINESVEILDFSIVLKEFVEDQKIDKHFFFLDFIINDMGTKPNPPLDMIWLMPVKEEWFNIQVKLLWLNDMLKELDFQLEEAESDVELSFDACDEFPVNAAECVGLLFNANIRIRLAFFHLKETQALIEDIAEEKEAVEEQLELLCSDIDDTEILDDERLCNKLFRKLTGMNKLLFAIHFELGLIQEKMNDARLELDIPLNPFDELSVETEETFSAIRTLSGEEMKAALLAELDTVEMDPELKEELKQALLAIEFDEEFEANVQQILDDFNVELDVQGNGVPDLEFVLDRLRDAIAEKETIELHKFPLLFERFRMVEEIIGGSVKPETFLNTGAEAAEAREMEGKVIRMFDMLDEINREAEDVLENINSAVSASQNNNTDDAQNFKGMALDELDPISEKLEALQYLKEELEYELMNLAEDIEIASNEDRLSPVAANHSLRRLQTMFNVTQDINEEIDALEARKFLTGLTLIISLINPEQPGPLLLSRFLWNRFITEKEAIEFKKMKVVDEALLEVESTLLGCEDDDHDGSFENEFCFRSCGFEGHCGDGVLQFALGEMCDDANNINDDGCTNACKLPVCGDGIVQKGEECDDGNLADGDQCSSECLIPDPDGDGFCNNGKEILPCQWNYPCDNDLDCGMGGACEVIDGESFLPGNGAEGFCTCPGLKCTEDSDCVDFAPAADNVIDCPEYSNAFCNAEGGGVGECSCED